MRKAKLKIVFTDAENAPMCSASETDEVLAGEEISYKLPSGFGYCKADNPKAEAIFVERNGKMEVWRYCAPFLHTFEEIKTMVFGLKYEPDHYECVAIRDFQHTFEDISGATDHIMGCMEGF